MGSYSAEEKVMISETELNNFINKNVRIILKDGKIIDGFFSYYCEKEPGEDEEDELFIDTPEIKYSIERPKIKKIEILKAC